jgi:hypothetical protein
MDINTITTFDNAGNITYSISGGIYASQYYQNYANLFQEFKLDYTIVHVVPVQVNGNQPPVAFAMVLINELMNVKFSEMPYLQGVTKIFGKGVTIIRYYSKGRTSDFNRWYNTGDEFNLNLLLKMHASENIGERALSPHYKILCRSRVLFRRPIIKNDSSKLKAEVYKELGNEIQQRDLPEEESKMLIDEQCEDACSKVMSEDLQKESIAQLDE